MFAEQLEECHGRLSAILFGASDLVGLPDWVIKKRYDVRITSSGNALGGRVRNPNSDQLPCCRYEVVHERQNVSGRISSTLSDRARHWIHLVLVYAKCTERTTIEIIDSRLPIV